MKKTMFRLFSVFALIAMVFTLVSCKGAPENGSQAKEALEEAGYTVEVQTGAIADGAGALLGLDGVNEMVTAYKDGKMFSAILFDNEDYAEDGYNKLKSINDDSSYIEMNDNWVYSGTSGTDDAKEIFD